MTAITLQNLTKSFPTPPSTFQHSSFIIHNLNLTIPAGTLFFLLGPSGCGKTTLLRMLAGFVTPTSGRILFGTRDMSAVPAHQRDTGMVFQSYALWPHMTVAQNVAFGLDVRKIKNPDRDRRVHESLALVQMDTYLDRRPNQLSGGQQQRVALARALAIRPQCLLLDEPLSNLDAKLRLEMRSEIRRIVKAAGTTAVYVTHDQKEALSMADLIAVMHQGRLQQLGTPDQLYRQPATRFVADFIGESNFIPGTIHSLTQTSLLIHTAAGPIQAANANNHFQGAVGQPVTLAIRPEAMVLNSSKKCTIKGTAGIQQVPSRGAASGEQDRGTEAVFPNIFHGQCLSTTYLGEMAEHLVTLPGLYAPLKIYEMNPHGPLAGMDVVVQIAAENVIIVES